MLRPAPPAPRRPQYVPITLAIFVTVLTLGLLIPAGWFGYSALSFHGSAETLLARVIDLRYSNEVKRTGSVQPVVGYSVDGQEYSFTSLASYRSWPYEIGDEIEILYLPHSPEEASLGTFSELWLLPVVLGGFGLLMLLVSSIIWWLWKNKIEINTSR